MPDKYLFDQVQAIGVLKEFFKHEKPNLQSFGKTVNQTFEAYTFAATIKWYQENDWSVSIWNPRFGKKRVFRLKFSTRGAPDKYSYVVCSKGDKLCQIRHQLRVATRAHNDKNNHRANICCDIVIVGNKDLTDFSSDEALPNCELISFGEVKHMSAYAELIAGFVGVVHELQPERLKSIRRKGFLGTEHIAPFLNVSGFLQKTAMGLKETLIKRKYDIDVYDHENKII